jgi:hypothetical protein
LAALCAHDRACLGLKEHAAVLEAAESRDPRRLLEQNGDAAFAGLRSRS